MAYTEFYTNFSSGSNMNGGSDENASPSFAGANGGWNSGTGVWTIPSGSVSGVTNGQFASVFLDGATAPVFVGRVTANDATTITVSTTAKSGTAPTTAGSGVSINVGGVWKGPNGAVAFPFGFVTNTLTDASSNPPRVNLKNNATYSVTAAMTHGNAGPVTFQGYSSSAGDGGRAVIDGGATGSGYTILTLSGAQTRLTDLIIQNNGDSGGAFSGLVVSGARCRLTGVVVNNTRRGVEVTGAGVVLLRCEVYAVGVACYTYGSGTSFDSCVAHDSAAPGFLNATNGSAAFVNCIADTLTTSSGHGWQISNGSSAAELTGCAAYNCGGSGVSATGANTALTVRNSLFASNAAYGVAANSAANGADVALENCAFHNNTSGQTNGLNASLVAGSVTLSADPFTDAANGDFRLNDTAGGGADCRGAGRGAFTQTAASYTGTVGYPDIGAAQSQASGGGGGGIIRNPGLGGGLV